MALQDIYSRVQAHMARRRRYYRAVDEINSLSQRDLADMRANRDDMLYWARKDILG